MKKTWKGVISFCRNITADAVICLFADGWQASATGNHTHQRDYLHFWKNQLNGKVLKKAEEYFNLTTAQEKYDPYTDEEYHQIEKKIRKILQGIYGG
jgi:hypothetical protein